MALPQTLSVAGVNAETVVLGLGEVRRKMLSLPKRVGTLIVRRALLEGAGVIRTEARRLAPVRAIKGGGRLQKAIVSQTRGVFRDADGVPVEHRAAVLIRKPTDGKRSVRSYAHFVEFGTLPHRIGKGSHRLDRKRGGRVVKVAAQFGGMHPGARPRPYMLPAFEAKKFEALQAIEARIRRELAQALAGDFKSRRAAG